MKLLSVNVGRPRLAQFEGGTISTAIFKVPVEGRVMVRRLNIDGDRQANLDVHGGEHKAVYAYPYEHYAYWAEAIGRDDFSLGQFGENVTVEGMHETDVNIGDRFCVGSAIVQVTQPRIPCRNLAVRMRMPEFPKLFLRSGRCGFYLRVEQEGEVGAGDTIERISTDPEGVSIHALFAMRFLGEPDRELIERALRINVLPPYWRGELEEMKATLDRDSPT